MRWAMMAGRPISVGRARPSSTTIWHGAQHALFLAFGVGHALLQGALAAVKMGFMVVPDAYTKLCSFSR
jgi:hypothetical protein